METVGIPAPPANGQLYQEGETISCLEQHVPWGQIPPHLTWAPVPPQGDYVCVRKDEDGAEDEIPPVAPSTRPGRGVSPQELQIPALAREVAVRIETPGRHNQPDQDPPRQDVNTSALAAGSMSTPPYSSDGLVVKSCCSCNSTFTVPAGFLVYDEMECGWCDHSAPHGWASPPRPASTPQSSASGVALAGSPRPAAPPNSPATPQTLPQPRHRSLFRPLPRIADENDQDPGHPGLEVTQVDGGQATPADGPQPSHLPSPRRYVGGLQVDGQSSNRDPRQES